MTIFATHGNYGRLHVSLRMKKKLINNILDRSRQDNFL